MATVKELELENAALRSQLDTAMQRQETLAQNVNDGLLEIRALRSENERLTKYSALTLTDLRAQLAVSEARCKIYEDAYQELQNAILDAQHILDKED